MNRRLRFYLNFKRISVFQRKFSILIVSAVFLLIINETLAQQYFQYHQQGCTNRLENALEKSRQRNIHVKSTSRSMQMPNPYSIYQALYGPQNQDENYDNSHLYDSYYTHPTNDRGYFAKRIDRDGILENGEQDPLYQTRDRPVLAVSRVEVEDLKVRLPPKPMARWVEIDECRFISQNSTLDTRLIFPDLTISGRVVLQPSGGKCNMILRLRHAGIEFHTTPIGFDVPTGNEESRRIAAATVRTDSHFAEPGFISVFAHGCQNERTGIRVRQNSKRRFGFAPGEIATSPDIALSEPQVVVGVDPSHGNGGSVKRWGKLHNSHYPNYDIREGGASSAPSSGVPELNLDWSHSNTDNNDNDNRRVDSNEFYEDKFYQKSFARYKRQAPYMPYRRNFPENRFRSNNRRQREFLDNPKGDQMNFDDDVLHFSGDELNELVQPDARAFADMLSGSSDDYINDAMSIELEKLFSMGVRSLLTTYMQRALQPAIKETLMENMGYRLSYG